MVTSVEEILDWASSSVAGGKEPEHKHTNIDRNEKWKAWLKSR